MVDAHRRLPDGRTLSEAMEFDHPVRVLADGTVTEPTNAPYLQGVYVYPPTAGGHGEIQVIPSNWQLMNGYSGQQGYRGPVMHSSEFIGGRMADDILSEPGIYVATTAHGVDSECDSEECNGDGTPDCNHGDHGWVVLYRPDYSDIYNCRDLKTLRRGLVAAIRADDSERANAYAWQAGAVYRAERDGMPIASGTEYAADMEFIRARQTIAKEK